VGFVAGRSGLKVQQNQRPALKNTTQYWHNSEMIKFGMYWYFVKAARLKADRLKPVVLILRMDNKISASKYKRKV
jgi:hypothetical protein